MLSELSEMYTREHSSNKSSVDPTRNHPRGTSWWQIPHGPWEDLLEIEPHWTIITLLSFTAFLFLFLSFHMTSWRHFPNKLLASTGLPCTWFQGHRDANLNQDTYLLIFFIEIYWIPALCQTSFIYDVRVLRNSCPITTIPILQMINWSPESLIE